MELKTFFAQDLLGNVIPNPTVYVYQPGTTTLATGLENETGGALTNPFTGNVNGKIAVAAPDGDYDIRVTGAGRDSIMRVRFIDSVAGSADILRADLASTAAGKGAALVGFKQSGTGAVDRTTLAKMRERMSPRDFGVVADGVTDDTAAWQLWIAACAAAKVGFICDERLYSRLTGKLVFPLVVQSMPGGQKALPIDLRHVEFLWAGPRNDIAIDIGTAPGASGYWPESYIFLPRLGASGTLQWPGSLGTNDIGIRIRQAFRCLIYENLTYGFTNGIVYSGCAYNTVFAKHISDSKFGLVYTTEGSNIDHSFANENTRYGGKIGNTSTASALGNAFMVVFTWDKVNSYRGHNANRFIAPCLESNGTATYQLPIWFDGCGTANEFRNVRLEGCRGPVAIFDGGGGSRACGTTIHIDYLAYGGQEISLRQVNGACGNILTGVGCSESSWSSGDLAKLVTSAGAAGAAHLRGTDLFFINAGTPTVNDFRRTETSATTAIKSNRNGIHLDAGGYARVATAIDTSRIKDLECAFDSADNFLGRPYFIALNAKGQILSGNATETFANPLTGVTYANEPFVKATAATGDSGQILVTSGPGYTMPADSTAARLLRVTVRPEVSTLIFGVVGASTDAVVRSLSVRGFVTYNVVGEAYPAASGRTALRVFSPVDDDGTDRIATAKPDTAGTLGYYGRGAVVFNRNAAAGQAAGWQCSVAGWLAPAWAGSTLYAVPGMLRINDSGKVYELTTPGTSAATGGPTGTTATWDGIVDGTARWRYIGVKAVFVTLPNAS